MYLTKLLEKTEYTLVRGTLDREIGSLVYDSRKVGEGALFVAGRLFTFAAELGMHWVGVEIFGIPADIMKFFIAIAVAFLNYAFGKLVVFRKKKLPAAGAEDDGEPRD